MNIIDVTSASKSYVPQWKQKQYIVHYLGVAGRIIKSFDGCGAHSLYLVGWYDL